MIDIDNNSDFSNSFNKILDASGQADELFNEKLFFEFFMIIKKNGDSITLDRLKNITRYNHEAIVGLLKINKKEFSLKITTLEKYYQPKDVLIGLNKSAEIKFFSILPKYLK